MEKRLVKCRESPGSDGKSNAMQTEFPGTAEAILSNLKIIHQRIQNACLQSHRNPQDVKLLLATKAVSPEKIKIALTAGEHLIGENKVQELKEKFASLQSIPHETHFIGHLQANKIKDVLKYADCIQSIDRLALAEKIQKRLEFENRTIDILIQVNTSYEQSKFGIPPEQALDLALQIRHLERINIKGLMTIGLFSPDIEQVRRCFRLLKTLQQQMFDHDISAHELSMGMSGDFETAIAEGSTLIRVG
ncbi:MAG: YggS family pyridoxal phosphate-dependent enzyme, partial [Gloeomargarita sp. HHBFW_bins_162]